MSYTKQRTTNRTLQDEVEILWRFIKSENLHLIHEESVTYEHMGATLTDTVLQAGINYKNTVKPRVERIKSTLPEARTTSGFLSILESQGTGAILKWKVGKKTRTLEDIVALLRTDNIETENDLKSWLLVSENEERLKNIKGVADKTLDYLKILCGIPAVAVDIHVERYVRLAGIIPQSYTHVSELVRTTAHAMKISPSALDYSIWVYMSEGRAKV